MLVLTTVASVRLQLECRSLCYYQRFESHRHGNLPKVVCGSHNEVAPDELEDDSYDVLNRKVQSHRIVRILSLPGITLKHLALLPPTHFFTSFYSQNYFNQKASVWFEVNWHARDQLCQRNGWHLHKIFATSTNMNSDAENTETNIAVLDNFITSCFGTIVVLL